MPGKKNRGLKPRNIIISAVVTFLVVNAIREQLSLTPEERTWHGRIYGVPYDFRVPTIERMRNTFWNEDSSELLVPQAFGVGWTLNFHALLHPKTQQRLY
jgi:hypothetical protein